MTSVSLAYSTLSGNNCMTYTIVFILLTTTWRSHDAILWYDLQLLNLVIDTFLYNLWMMRPLSNTSRKNIPDMFNWIEVWRPGWPVHHTDTFVINEGYGHPSCVGMCIILHSKMLRYRFLVVNKNVGYN